MQNFNYHQHTYRCKHADLDMQDEEYILEYIKMGLKKIAFTDHCPQKSKVDKRPHMRMDYEQKDEYLSSIKKLKDKYSDIIEIETGYEVEYLPGEEENLEELKQETNKIILGQHLVYDNDKNLKKVGLEEITGQETIRHAEYIKRALELKVPDIIAHPDFFMAKATCFGDAERLASNIICETAQKYSIPLEININDIFKKVYYENKEINNLPLEEQRRKLSKVKYPCKQFWEIVSNYNIQVLYGIDVHHRGQILLFNKLVEFANEILGDDIINKLHFI